MLGNTLSKTMQAELVTYVDKHGGLVRETLAALTDGDVVFITDHCTSGNRG